MQSLGSIQLLPTKHTYASGPALAANLSTLCLMLGTRFLPSCAGRILFLEYDKEEQRALPSLERFMCQLRLSGTLDKLAGLVFGALQPIVKSEESEEDSIARILSDCTRGTEYPVLYNTQFGHMYPGWYIVNGWSTSISDTDIRISKAG
jgi:muramoyltetrapeptide carboxypeptidase